MNSGNENKKVLFSYATLNSGHQKAAEAIKEALLSEGQDIETKAVEALGYTYSGLGKFIHKFYLMMAVHLSSVYDFLWDNVKIEKRIAGLRKVINKGSLDKFEKLLSSFPAGVAVCTQALPCGFLATLKQKRDFSFKLIAVITDCDVHAYWMYEGVDIYCVPNLEAKNKLITRGIPGAKIRTTGIPIKIQFSQKKDKDALKSELGLRKGLPYILIMGGNYGFGPLNKIITNLDKSKNDFVMIVVTGRNKRLYSQLEKKLSKIKKTIKLFGYVDNVALLMQASDILITKPGGITVSEALASDLPMILTRGIKGQETANFEYLVKRGAAIGIDRPGQVTQSLDDLIAKDSRLKIMKDNIQKIAKPRAAFEISQIIRNFL